MLATGAIAEVGMGVTTKKLVRVEGRGVEVTVGGSRVVKKEVEIEVEVVVE